jgi:hypothetical protein
VFFSGLEIFQHHHQIELFLLNFYIIVIFSFYNFKVCGWGTKFLLEEYIQTHVPLMSRTPFIRIIAFETAKLFLSIYSTPSSPEALLFFYFKINHVRHSAIYSYGVK